MAQKGFFRPLHPERYDGNPLEIVYRSGWEMKLMAFLDNHPHVKKWGSEEISFPYFDPTRGHPGRYYPDFLVEFLDGRKILIEVKPKNQVTMPVMKDNKNPRSKQRFMREMIVWARNQAKWKEAEKYCKQRGWKFQIMTEDQLGIKYG